MIGHLLLAASTFIITNIDDLLILSFFFASPRHTTRSIITGQFLGISLLILISLSGVVFRDLVPVHWIALLGIFPVILGVKELLEKGEERDDEPATNERSTSVWRIALVTVANGGDNIGVYTPLFARTPTIYVVIYVGVFLLLTGGLCYFGYYFVNHPRLKVKMTHFSKRLMPYFLIGLGLFILSDFFFR
jgi:cadmium resistance protein CadD (predicted permease)